MNNKVIFDVVTNTKDAIIDLKQLDGQSKQTSDDMKRDFDNSSKKASKSVGGFSKSSMKGMKGIAMSAAKSATAMVMAFGAATMQIATQFDTLQEGLAGFGLEASAGMMSAMTGVGMAAKIAGGSLGELASSALKCGKSLYMSQRPTSKQAKAFSFLGIETINANGELLTFQEILKQVPAAINETNNSFKTAIAMFSIFGSGAKTLYQINAVGVETFKQLASAISSVITPEVIQAFLNLQVQMDKVALRAQVTAIVFFSKLAPAIEFVMTAVNTLMILLTPFLNMLGSILDVVNRLLQPIIAIADAWNGLWTAISTGMPIGEALRGWLNDITAMLQPLINLVNTLTTAWDNLWGSIANMNILPGGGFGGSGSSASASATTQINNMLNKTASSFFKAPTTLNATFNMTIPVNAGSGSSVQQVTKEIRTELRD